GAPSAADGTATAFDSGEAATQGMPRRDKQLRSSCHQSCCWHAAGGSETSAPATSSSSRASGYNGSTPTTLANATREADATKRKFEYKAHLLRTELRPPNLAQKQRRCGGTMSAQWAWSSGTWNRAYNGRPGALAIDRQRRRPPSLPPSTRDDGRESIRTRARPSAAPARGAPARPRGGSGTAPPAAPRSRSRSPRSA